MVTGRVQPYTMAASAVLFGLGVLIGTVITRAAESQASVDQEKIIRQLEQVVKALDSDDVAAAVEYLKDTVKGYQWVN
jgi:hypothetical protein